MDDAGISGDQLSHLSRLALTGRRQDVLLYIRRLARKYRETSPDLYEQLQALLHESPSPKSPLRSKSIEPVPVDLDSRLQLIRQENPVVLDFEPIWHKTVLDQLEQLISERSSAKALLKADLFPTSTALFTGAPGVGKSLAARWIASRLQLPLLVLDLSAVMSSFLGRTGTNVRYVLDYAKKTECVMLLDELDAVAKRRDDSAEIGELKRLVTVLLQEIDDWPHNGLLIAATNHPALLDPAVWRRFEVLVEFPMPTDEQVAQAVSLFMGPQAAEVESLQGAISMLLRNMSFSDIERSLLRVRREAAVHDRPLAECLSKLAREGATSLPREGRFAVAAELVKLGYTQRRAHELTGVSRDTIRNRTSDS